MCLGNELVKWLNKLQHDVVCACVCIRTMGHKPMGDIVLGRWSGAKSQTYVSF